MCVRITYVSARLDTCTNNLSSTLLVVICVRITDVCVRLDMCADNVCVCSA
jgi:hypothetical protein